MSLKTVACPACDLLQRVPLLPPGGKARCPRCGETLASRPADPLDRPLALTLAATIVFIIANTQPLMGLSAVGRQASTTILGGEVSGMSTIEGSAKRTAKEIAEQLKAAAQRQGWI